MDETDVETAIERAGEITLGRLHELVSNGYRPVLGKDHPAIWLEHPAPKYPHRQLILFPDGLIVSQPRPSSYEPALRILRTDELAYRKFMGTIPKATFWDELKPLRERSKVWVLWFVLAVGAWLGSQIVSGFLD